MKAIIKPVNTKYESETKVQVVEVNGLLVSNTVTDIIHIVICKK